MKKKFVYFMMAAALSLAAVGCTHIQQEGEDYVFKIYENHDISACGVKDPLNNLPWLQKYVMDNPKMFGERIFVYRNISDDIDYIVIERGSTLVFEDMPRTYIGVTENVPPQPDLVVYSCIGEQIFNIRENSEFWYDFKEENEQVGKLRHVKIQTKGN